MLLYRSSRGSICNRCSLRQQILALQQRRLRHSTPHSGIHRADKQSSSLGDLFAAVGEEAKVVEKRGIQEKRLPLRYYSAGDEGNGIQRDLIPRRRRSEPLTGSNFIRKSFIGDTSPPAEVALRQWGLDTKSQNTRNEERFQEALVDGLRKVKREVQDAPVLKQWAREEGSGDREDGEVVVEAEEEDVGTGVSMRKKTTGGKRGAKRGEDFEKMWRDFTRGVLEGGQLQRQPSHPGKRARTRDILDTKNQMEDAPPGGDLWRDLRDAYSIRGTNGLEDRIKFAFYGHVTGSRFTASDVRHQKILADLRYPNEWFPATRTIQREIHLHVGPTNSGKTYHALKRLEQAHSGAYAGPLRLLAHEVYTRMNGKGKACALITGEERRAMDMAESVVSDAGSRQNLLYNYDMMACTVEMMPLNKSMDVAVIDEIQMIGSPERGWAWTQALLGVKAKEVHLCGEERTVPLIKELCASIGEKLTVHHYERLSPLMVADSSLNGDLKKLRKGDCIVSFSVMGIHALRKQIERQTGKKVATVYGSLPPETRAQQARLFNDPDNDYDYLVASDAVGMGLNLAIKRVIFESANKFDGVSRRTLAVADIKQIGGRAGRFRIANQANEKHVSEQELAAAKGDESPLEVNIEEEAAVALEKVFAPPTSHPKSKKQTEIYTMPPSGDVPDGIGIITTLEKFDYPIVRAAMSSEPEPILTAGLFPPGPVLERFSSYFPPGTPFSYILTRLHELSQMHARFHLCGLKDQVWIADLIEPVQGLTISDRNIICSSPAAKGDADLWSELMPEFARAIASQSGGEFLEIKSLPLEILDEPVSVRRDYLRGLERLHKGVVSYLWLSYRFHGIFSGRGVAGYVKGLVEEKIEGVLKQFSFEEKQRKKFVRERERVFLRGLEDFSGNPAGNGLRRKGGVRAGTESVVPRDAVVAVGEDSVVDDLRNGITAGTRATFGGEADDVIFEEDERVKEVVADDYVKEEKANSSPHAA